jgi:hypothetical protein
MNDLLKSYSQWVCNDTWTRVIAFLILTLLGLFVIIAGFCFEDISVVLISIGSIIACISGFSSAICYRYKYKK